MNLTEEQVIELFEEFLDENFHVDMLTEEDLDFVFEEEFPQWLVEFPVNRNNYYKLFPNDNAIGDDTGPEYVRDMDDARRAAWENTPKQKAKRKAREKAQKMTPYREISLPFYIDTKDGKKVIRFRRAADPKATPTTTGFNRPKVASSKTGIRATDHLGDTGKGGTTSAGKVQAQNAIDKVNKVNKRKSVNVNDVSPGPSSTTPLPNKKPASIPPPLPGKNSAPTPTPTPPPTPTARTKVSAKPASTARKKVRRPSSTGTKSPVYNPQSRIMQTTGAAAPDFGNNNVTFGAGNKPVVKSDTETRRAANLRTISKRKRRAPTRQAPTRRAPTRSWKKSVFEPQN